MLESNGFPEQSSAGETVVNAGFDRKEVIALAKEDLNFLAALALPDVFKHFFPEIHLTAWNLLREKASISIGDFSKLALGLPRGHAKTTLIKLFALYCILFTDRQFILIVCANDPLAQNFLSDVAGMLSAPNIVNVFGNWRLVIETDNAHVKKFSFLGRNIILAASGKGAVRGLNIKNLRPDVIIMDDMQTKEDSDSPTQAENDLNWMIGTLLKLKDPRRCLYIYIGNMYHSQGCILRKLKSNPNWISFIIGAILSDGKVIWPELHSYASLMAEFANDASLGKPEIFLAEVQNDPDAGISTLININNIPQNPYHDNPVCLGKFIIIDVAGDKPLSSDDTVIGLFELYEADIVYRKVIAECLNPGDTIKKALTLAIAERANLIAVEAVAYQSSLLFWFEHFCTELHIEGIMFVPCHPKGRSKNSRILQWLKRLLPTKRPDGLFDPPREYLHSEVRAKVTWQISQFRQNKRDNKDDIMDTGAYAEEVSQEYGEFITIPALATDVSYEGAKVVENNSCF